MQDELELHGQWYIPRTDETFSGSLFIHKEKKQIYLHIVSVAKNGEFMAPMKAWGHCDLIKGEINTGGSILLYDCNIGSLNNRIGQNTTAIVEVGAAFWHLNIDNTDELCFRRVDVDFGDIVEWSGMCSYEADASGDKFVWNRKPEVCFAIHENLCLRIVPYQGKISMWSFQKEYRLSQGVAMTLEYQTDATWEQIRLDIRTLSDLITFGMNRAVYLEKLEYYHTSHKDEDIFPDYIHPADAFVGDRVEGKTIPGGSWEWLFSMQDLITEDCRCLRNWYNKYEKLKPVVELYEAAHRFRGISVEMLFLNLVQALETYHARFVCDSLKQYITMVDVFLRETYSLQEGEDWNEHVLAYRNLLIAQDEKKSKSIHLKSRLGYLFLANFKYVFSYLDYRKDDFIQLVLDTRNYYTHYAEEKKDRTFPVEKLPYVNGILMGVLQYYLLQEIGINNKKIEYVVGNQMERVMRSFDMFGN
ncbi:MAG: hypothetical protein J1F42_00750 [Lachnospiraceae bacterium]|nr:hypothetical protein [Lachnospiraceae bacterium]